MTSGNRAKLLESVFKQLSKRYEACLPAANRSVFEQAIFGVCLENASLEAAEAAFARLKEGFWDWNEVRVSSPRELAESLEGLPQPVDRGRTLKSVIHSIFETYYEFDLERLRKMTHGQVAKEVGKFPAMTPFVGAFVLQAGLKAHAIPLDEVCLRVLGRLGIVQKNSDAAEVRASLERLIPKAKGPAFSSLIRQLAFDTCVSGKPKCSTCVLAGACPTAQAASAPSTGEAVAKRSKGAPRSQASSSVAKKKDR